MRLHLEEMRREPAFKPRFVASLEHFVQWAQRQLKEKSFEMKGWSTATELEKRFSEWSQELNLLLTLGFLGP